MNASKPYGREDTSRNISLYSNFDWVTYINNYPDLKEAGITTREQALHHWNTHGFIENRTYKSIVDAEIMNDTCDWQTYLNNYPDLHDAGIFTKEAAIQHWNQHGKREGRTYESIYDWQKHVDNMFDFELPQPKLSNIIPRVIYQTWKNKDLPHDMAITVQKIKDANPDFNHELFDDNDCYNFLASHFPPQILYAYESLAPGAYKADLWRYCVLYLYGGIYLDIKFEPVNNFSFKELIYNDYFCYDFIGSQPTNGNSIYNAVMVCYPGDNRIKQCIYEIYNNVCKKYYGNSYLEPTGPYLLGKFITKEECFLYNSSNTVEYNNKTILTQYNTYRIEQPSSTHYSVYWKNRNVYINKNIFNYIIIKNNALPSVNMDIIPKTIFQKWRTLELPNDMKETMIYNKTSHPDYAFELFDDDMCYRFLDMHFHPIVGNAYHRLVPDAYKTDFWSYCVLYIYGGIYMDTKFKLCESFNFDSIISSEHGVKDRSLQFINDKGIYNGLIIVKPRNNYMLKCIIQIINNIKTNYYGCSPSYPTGTGLLGEIFPHNYPHTLQYSIEEEGTSNETTIIRNSNTQEKLLESYSTHLIDQRSHTSYEILWHEKAIYTM